MVDASGSALQPQLAALHADEAELDDRSVLLLWFLRNVFLVDALDAYEFVREEARAQGVDGFYVEDQPTRRRLDLFRVFPGPRPVTSADIVTVVSDARRLHEALDGLDPRRPSDILPESVMARLLAKAKSRDPLPPWPPEVRLVLVSAAPMAPDAEPQAAASSNGMAVRVHDRGSLERQARAVASPSLVDREFEFKCRPRERFVTQIGAGSVLVCPVEAAEFPRQLAEEIKDRTLFDLNVRFELRSGRVRQALDRALRSDDEHANFLASHNGLTVVCDGFELDGDSVSIRRLSVVNGAQSVIAFAANEAELDSRVKVLCKFVAVGAQESVARDIAIRSNTQNPVTARNLRALDPKQLALRDEFEDYYPRFEYQTRPDQRRAFRTVIENDVAAQLLCAVYTQEPWLAVKRDTLFRDANYRRIFGPDIHAQHVLLCHYIRARVQDKRPSFPELYRRSWALTALIGVYLVGQLLRSGDELQRILERPQDAVEDPGVLEPVLDALAEHAARVLTERASKAEAAQREQRPPGAPPPKLDDFKVDFKRETYLRRLAADARRSFNASFPSPIESVHRS